MKQLVSMMLFFSMYLSALPHKRETDQRHTDGRKGDNTEINSIVKRPPFQPGISRSSNNNNRRHHKRRNNQLFQRNRETGAREPSSPIDGQEDGDQTGEDDCQDAGEEPVGVLGSWRQLVVNVVVRYCC